MSSICWFSWETNLTHKRWLSPTDGESDFLPLQVFFFRVWHNTGFCDKSIVFLLLAQNLGDASQACYQSTLISGMSFFIQWYFPLSGRSTNENLWDIVASPLFLGPSRLRRSLVPSSTACFARPDRRACSQAMYKWVYSPSIQWQWQIRNWAKIRDYLLTTKIINYSPTDMNPNLPLYDQRQSDFNTLSDISSLLFWKIEGK